MTNKEVKNIINTNYMADMANYADVLNFNNFFGKTPKDVIEIFGNYGEMVYSREEYLWKLSFLLSSEYSFRKESRYSEELKKKTCRCISYDTDGRRRYLYRYLSSCIKKFRKENQ